MNNSRWYILITAVKNEEKNLPKLIQSVEKQTIKPILWVIVDDGSKDNSTKIIEKAKSDHKWIKSIKLHESNRDVGFHLSKVIKKGFDFAREYCRKNCIDYEYLGNVDGDIILEDKFFEKLIKEFEKDPMLGIAGSGTQYIKENRVIQPKMAKDEPSGGDMLIRRKCFEGCKGILISPGWDSTIKCKARLRGWKTMRFEEIKATEVRDLGRIEGWKRYIHKGECDYYLNLNPFHIIYRSCKLLFKKPYFIGIIYFFTYLRALVQRKEKIRDLEVKEYFRNKWRKSFNKIIFW